MELQNVTTIAVAIAVAIALAVASTGAVTAQEYEGPPIGDEEPTDPDGDGLYEDVNGDGNFTIADVQVFFVHMDSDQVRENSELFDFAGRDDGEVTIGDVQHLFLELVDDE